MKELLSHRLNLAGVSIPLVMEAIDLENQMENLVRMEVKVSEPVSGDAQSKLESRCEIAANYISGFVIAYVTWTLLAYGPMAWGWFDIHDSFIITSIFTVVSVARSYYWRRLFATGLHKVVQRLVAEWLKR